MEVLPAMSPMEAAPSPPLETFSPSPLSVALSSPKSPRGVLVVNGPLKRQRENAQSPTGVGEKRRKSDEAGLKKKVSWAPDERLTQVKTYFIEMDHEPQKVSKLPHRSPARLMVASVAWGTPSNLNIPDKMVRIPPKDSTEVTAQAEREKSIFETIYPKLQMIPPNPSDPPNEPDYDDSKTREIPFESQHKPSQPAPVAVSNAVSGSIPSLFSSAPLSTQTPNTSASLSSSLQLVAALSKNPNILTGLLLSVNNLTSSSATVTSQSVPYGYSSATYSSGAPLGSMPPRPVAAYSTAAPSSLPAASAPVYSSVSAPQPSWTANPPPPPQPTQYGSSSSVPPFIPSGVPAPFPASFDRRPEENAQQHYWGSREQPGTFNRGFPPPPGPPVNGRPPQGSYAPTNNPSFSSGPSTAPPPSYGNPSPSPPSSSSGFGDPYAPTNRSAPSSSSHRKGRPCVYFVSRNGCRSGDSCSFIHDPNYQPSSEDLDVVFRGRNRRSRDRPDY